MTETPTPRPEQENPFADIEMMQANDEFQRESRQRAQQLLAEPAPEDQQAETPRWNPAKKAAATVVAGAALVTGGLVTLDHTLPQEEIATVTTTVEQGGDITSAVDIALNEIELQAVDPANPTERQDVISQAVQLNTDENNIVQPGETVTVTATKSPIFGDVRYRAVPDPVAPPSSAPEVTTTIPSPEQQS